MNRNLMMAVVVILSGCSAYRFVELSGSKEGMGEKCPYGLKQSRANCRREVATTSNKARAHESSLVCEYLDAVAVQLCLYSPPAP